MTAWTYPPGEDEPIDPEVLPLCEALQRAGFDTIFSCGGHEAGPYVAWVPNGREVPFVQYLQGLEAGVTSFALWLSHIYQSCRIPGVKHYWQIKIILHGATPAATCRRVAGWVDEWRKP